MRRENEILNKQSGSQREYEKWARKHWIQRKWNSNLFKTSNDAMRAHSFDFNMAFQYYI